VFVPTKAVVDDAVLAHWYGRVIFLAVRQEEFSQISDNPVGSVDEVKSLHCLFDVFWVWKAFSPLWWSIWKPEWHKRTFVDDCMSRTRPVMGTETIVGFAIGVAVAVINHDCC
jgi:hypothetical protein